MKSLKKIKKVSEHKLMQKINTRPQQLLSKRPDRFSNGVWPCYYSKAKGSCIWDLDGNQYLDMSIGGIGATILGYADKDVDNAVKKIISMEWQAQTTRRGYTCKKINQSAQMVQ